MEANQADRVHVPLLSCQNPNRDEKVIKKLHLRKSLLVPTTSEREPGLPLRAMKRVGLFFTTPLCLHRLPALHTPAQGQSTLSFSPEASGDVLHQNIQTSSLPRRQVTQLQGLLHRTAQNQGLAPGRQLAPEPQLPLPQQPGRKGGKEIGFENEIKRKKPF